MKKLQTRVHSLLPSCIYKITCVQLPYLQLNVSLDLLGSLSV